MGASESGEDAVDVDATGAGLSAGADGLGGDTSTTRARYLQSDTVSGNGCTSTCGVILLSLDIDVHLYTKRYEYGGSGGRHGSGKETYSRQGSTGL